MAISDAQPADNLMSRLVKSVEEEISKQSQEIVERHKKEIGEELDKVIRETIGKLGVNIARYTQIQYANDRLIIEISDRRPER